MTIIISITIIAIILIVLAIHGEKKSFNNGYCKVCNQKLRHFDNDSQGGRGYTCPNTHYSVWVSYHCVDRCREQNE